MHYFIKVDSEIRIASCEKDAGAPPIIAAGYIECDHASFSAAWAARDAQRKAELEREEPARLQAMAWAERLRLGV